MAHPTPSEFKSHPEEVEALMRGAYPETRICDCEPGGVVMVRNAALDLAGETPRERYERGCPEGFECPVCGAYELFPPEGLSLRDIKRAWPGWGSRRGGSSPLEAA